MQRLRPWEIPFRVQRMGELAFRPRGTDWAALERRLEARAYRVAIVGPEGSGKTTLMRELGERLRTKGYATRWGQLTRDRRTPPAEQWRAVTAALGERDIVLLDGAGHLLPPTWWAFRWRARRAGKLIVTVHRGSPLPVLLRTRTDAMLLAELMRELLAADLPGGGMPSEQQIDAEAARLWQQHAGNMRDALLTLCDQYARPR